MSCANVSKELKAVGMKANELAEADAKGMMLSVDELDLLTQLREVELLSESNQYYDTNVPLTAAQVSELNNLGLKYGSNTVRVLGGRVKNGNVQATVNVNGKTYYNKDLNKMSTERGSVSDVMKYASTPRGERKGTYNELLKDARISSLKDAIDVLDKLRELDGVSKDSKEFKRHMDAVKYIVGATVRAIPELAVYVDESVLEIHDAIMTGIATMEEAVKEYNKKFFEMSLSWNYAEVVYNKAVETLNKEGTESILRKALSKKDYESVLEGISTLKSVVEGSKIARRELLENDITVEQMVYNKDSAYKYKAMSLSDDVNKQLEALGLTKIEGCH